MSNNQAFKYMYFSKNLKSLFTNESRMNFIYQRVSHFRKTRISLPLSILSRKYNNSE